MTEDNGDIYTIQQLEMMEDCLHTICEEARKMSNMEFDMTIMFDNPQIARATEQLIGIATEEKIALPSVESSQGQHNEELNDVVNKFIGDDKPKM